MKVLRHHDISDDREPVLLSDRFQHVQENIAGFGRTQQLLPAITTAGDEMKIIGTKKALEAARQREDSTELFPPFRKQRERMGHPIFGIRYNRRLKGWATRP